MNQTDIYKEIDEARAEKKQQALQIMMDRLPNATNTVIKLSELDHEEYEPASAPLLRIKLDAAKLIIKCGGLEVDRVEHSGEVAFTPVNFKHEVDDK